MCNWTAVITRLLIELQQNVKRRLDREWYIDIATFNRTTVECKDKYKAFT